MLKYRFNRKLVCLKLRKRNKQQENSQLNLHRHQLKSSSQKKLKRLFLNKKSKKMCQLSNNLNNRLKKKKLFVSRPKWQLRELLSKLLKPLVNLQKWLVNLLLWENNQNLNKKRKMLKLRDKRKWLKL
jgi:hypothetical protein